VELYSVVDIQLIQVDSDDAKIKSIFDTVLKVHKNEIAASITKLMGGQWQLVISKVENTYLIIREIEDALNTIEKSAYYGAGIGSISTQIYADTRKMDGHAFILARDSLKLITAKEAHYSKIIPTKDCRIYIKYEFNSEDNYREFRKEQVLNCLIQNNEILLSKITDKQKETIDLYERYGSYNKLMKVFPELKKGTVSDKMNKSNYWMIQSNMETIHKILKSFTARRTVGRQ